MAGERFSFVDGKPDASAARYDMTPVPQIGESSGEILTGALADTFSMGRPGAKTTAQVLTQPEGVGEHLIQAAVTAPLIAAGGGAAAAGAKAAPAVVRALAPAAGRIATGAGISAAKGEDAWGVLMDAAAAGVSEAGLAAVGKLASPLAKAAETLDAIRAKINRGPDGPVNVLLLKTFVDRVRMAPDEVARSAALKNAVEQLNDMSAGIGNLFRTAVVNARVHLPFFRGVSAGVPLPASQAAKGVKAAAGSNVGRALADTAATEDVAPGLPAGVVGGAYGLQHMLGRAGSILP